MSKVIFNENDIIKLQKNKNVKKVSKLSITYTDEFKRTFIEEYLKGRSPLDIFYENGFDIDIIGKKRAEQCAIRWKRAYLKDGILGLVDGRTSSGRHLERELTPSEKLKRQEDKIKLLEEKIEILKKVDVEERRMVNEKGCFSENEAFQLIYEMVKEGKYKNKIRYLCEEFGVSRSGYYGYIKSKDKRDKREELDAKVKDNIILALNKSGYNKGTRSIKMILENDFNINYSRKRIDRIIKKFDMV